MADARLQLTFSEDSGSPEPFITLPGGIGLYRRRAEISLGVVENVGLTADIRFQQCSFKLGSNGDSFLAELIPGQQDTKEFDVGIHWDAGGVSFAGGAMLDLTIPITAKTPVVKLKALHILIRPNLGGDPSVPVELSVDLTGSLSVISVSVERIGITAEFFLSNPNRAIPLGPISADIDFKPPSGAGLSLDVAGIIKGGGFVGYDPVRERYSGILAVSLFGIGVTATAIITTKPAFSLLTIITADFRPVGIDIGFGFTINAIGGLLGLNRGVDVMALREGIRNNAVSSLMFPANPIEDGPRIINDLDRIFPAMRDHFLIGPMIQLGWGKPTGMITLSLGVVVQIPDPNIVIIGIFRLLVPPVEQAMEMALLRIQVNFAGGIDFSKQLIWFDAALFDSRLVMYTLEGEMAARLRFGASANFAVTVGGFHPRYVPAADLEIPQLRRIAINLLPTSDNPRLRIESYYAATSNTLQHGAKLEAYASALGFSLRGFLGYDVLVQVSPLYIDAQFGAGVGIYLDDEEIMGLTLNLHVTGPSPWHVDGEASFTFIVKDITIPVRATFGGSDAPALPDVDVGAKFLDQLNKEVRNWKAQLPDPSQMLVQLVSRIEIPADVVLAHPSATIEFDQKMVPLNLVIQRFGAAKPSGANIFSLISISAGGKDFVPDKLESEFAPAQFFELSNDDKLSAPAFRKLASGIRANASSLVHFGEPAPREFVYRDDLIDLNAQEFPHTSAFAREYNTTAMFALGGLAGSAVGRSDLYDQRVRGLPTGDEVKVSGGGWAIVDKSTMTTVGTVMDNAIAATQALGSMVSSNPALNGKLAVVADYELV